MRRLAAFLAFAAIISCPRAFAAEPFALYDSFSSTTINRSLWNAGERVRVIEKGVLRLGQRDHGLNNSDSGRTGSSWSVGMTNPSPVTEIAASVKVNARLTTSCAANPNAGQSRARILGTFFNTGTPTPGSFTGDMMAQLWAGRVSNSTDAPGVLQVRGTLLVCTNADCSTSTPVGTPVNLGTTTVGAKKPILLAMAWDKTAKTFYFARDNNAFHGSITYTDSDANPPGLPTMSLNTRLDMPSCQSAPPPVQAIDATYDNVFVNASAVPL